MYKWYKDASEKFAEIQVFFRTVIFLILCSLLENTFGRVLSDAKDRKINKRDELRELTLRWLINSYLRENTCYLDEVFKYLVMYSHGILWKQCGSLCTFKISIRNFIICLKRIKECNFWHILNVIIKNIFKIS